VPTPTVVSPEVEKQYVSGREAMRLLPGATHYRLQRLAVMGAVRALVRPGIPIKYNRADLLKLKRDMGAEG